MPYKVKKTKAGTYRVSGPSGVHAKGTTKEKAEAQERLLRAVDHGWKPTGKPVKKRAASKKTNTRKKAR
jgi:hypothetical protein